jgi:hypothetical protein
LSDAAEVVAGLLAEARCAFERCLRAMDEAGLTLAGQCIDELEALAADGEALASLDRRLYRRDGAAPPPGPELDDGMPF